MSDATSLETYELGCRNTALSRRIAAQQGRRWTARHSATWVRSLCVARQNKAVPLNNELRLRSTELWVGGGRSVRESRAVSVPLINGRHRPRHRPRLAPSIFAPSFRCEVTALSWFLQQFRGWTLIHFQRLPPRQSDSLCLCSVWHYSVQQPSTVKVGHGR